MRLAYVHGGQYYGEMVAEGDQIYYADVMDVLDKQLRRLAKWMQSRYLPEVERPDTTAPILPEPLNEIKIPEVKKYLADMAVKRYADESVRTNNIEAKANPALSVTGVLLVLAAGLVTKAPLCLSDIELRLYYASLVVGFVTLFCALYFFFQTIAIAEYRYVDLKKWVTEDDLARTNEEFADFLDQIATKFTEYVAENSPKNTAKAEHYERGLKFLAAGVIILGCLIISGGCGAPRFF